MKPMFLLGALILVPMSANAADLRPWAGTWAHHDDRIKLTVVGNRIIASGEAYYPSANHQPWPNLGDFRGRGRVAGNVLVIGKDAASDLEVSCKVTMKLDGERLLVDDNGQCGGSNVSFKGTYTRQVPKPMP